MTEADVKSLQKIIDQMNAVIDENTWHVLSINNMKITKKEKIDWIEKLKKQTQKAISVKNEAEDLLMRIRMDSVTEIFRG